jgi:hypothetical protein
MALIIEEVYYDSYIIPSLISALIFYALKFFNILNFEISWVIKEFQLGLEVKVMHSGQIRILLEDLDGKVTIVNKLAWASRPLDRLLLLKYHVHITFTYKMT